MSIFLATAKHQGEDLKVVTPVGDSALCTTYGAVEERLVRFSDLEELRISEDAIDAFRETAEVLGWQHTEDMVTTITRSWTWARLLRHAAGGSALA